MTTRFVDIVQLILGLLCVDEWKQWTFNVSWWTISIGETTEPSAVTLKPLKNPYKINGSSSFSGWIFLCEFIYFISINVAFNGFFSSFKNRINKFRSAINMKCFVFFSFSSLNLKFTSFVSSFQLPPPSPSRWCSRTFQWFRHPTFLMVYHVPWPQFPNSFDPTEPLQAMP